MALANGRTGTTPNAPSGAVRSMRERRGSRRKSLKTPWIAIAWLAIIVIVGIGAPLFAPHDPIHQELGIVTEGPGFSSAEYGLFLFGTDNLGRDMLSRLIWGIRPMLIVAVLSVLCAGIVGLAVGLAASNGGRRLEFLLMRLSDIQLSIPTFVLAMLMAFTFTPGIKSSILAIAVATWPYYARLVRADVITVRSSAFVQLARVAGRRGIGLVFRHVVPNALNSFLALCVLNLGVSVMIGASLSFLGVGVQPPQPDWGSMIGLGKDYLESWWMVVAPGLAFCLFVMALNTFGNWTRFKLSADTGTTIGAPALPPAVAQNGLAKLDVDTKIDAVEIVSKNAVLEVRGLSVRDNHGKYVVQDASVTLEQGKVMGVIGESGSGKSTLCKAITDLLAPGLTATHGTVTYEGESIAINKVAKLRGRHIGMVFQDPLSSLNPLRKIGWQLGETREIHKIGPQNKVGSWVHATLRSLGFKESEAIADAYPHQLSGGMRQRICVGIAFSGEPKVVLADEPTTALDVSLQGKVLRLLLDDCRESGASLVLISHDVRVIRDTADDVTVMYGGRILEQGSVTQVLQSPRSPYTTALLDSVPELTSALTDSPMKFIPLADRTVPPSLGCPFAGRCEHEVDVCRVKFPQVSTSSDSHSVWCHNPVPELEEVGVRV